MIEHPLQSFVKTAMENLKDMVNVNTTIGEPVVAPDGTFILPVCKISYGFAAGGSDLGKYGQEPSIPMLPFGGGTGGGVSVTPLAFLIIGKTGVQTISLEDSANVYQKILDMTPQLLDKLQVLLQQYQTGSGNVQ
ncbi:GerW family sporulation protein [Paenibacillus radicis (ex Xue et al. 2023)]|uniref:GerW family sporulation protein n=1 Tax=Paenibacillus radicis (ex Xue et al. 2023) TaxID=2972489 RepID=A0ABT1YB53_9BACL|nr:GerW family sporulation protein [Paenibacillus radicis (ex Xue et al. 2023)]MCR8630407.1 GerW family sporulation protein [Paenibacillus radicis (ex Xue et al. 2023)]